jgi:hypothetical protein
MIAVMLLFTRRLAVTCGLVALLAGCSGSTRSVAPIPAPQPSKATPTPSPTSPVSITSYCGPPAAKGLTICVRVPAAASAMSLQVTDTIFGVPSVAAATPTLANCPVHVNERFCIATFANAPQGINDVEVDTYPCQAATTCPASARATFPVDVAPSPTLDSAVLGGTTASVAVEPFQGSTLPLGQIESVWVVARDAAGSVIVGPYSQSITVTPSAHLMVAVHRGSNAPLTSSSDAIAVQTSWLPGFAQSDTGALTVTTAGLSATTPIGATSGVVYMQVGPNVAGLSPGPVVSGGGAIYFSLNDDRSGACAPNCRTAVYRFVPDSGASAESLPLPDYPHISQLYYSKKGALWASTQNLGQPAVAPGLRIVPGPTSMPFSSATVEQLPASSYGSPVGFVNDGSGNVWISTCETVQGVACAPAVVVVPDDANGQAPSPAGPPITLPASCGGFSSHAGSVFDIGYLAVADTFYVLGGTGSAASGTTGNNGNALWQIPVQSRSASCVRIDQRSFDPSPYFAATKDRLLFGVAGTVPAPAAQSSDNDNGFYTIGEDGVLDVDASVLSTPVHVTSSGQGVEYVDSNARMFFAGPDQGEVGSYYPDSPKPRFWNTFPGSRVEPGDTTLPTTSGIANAPSGGTGTYFTTYPTHTCKGLAGTWLGNCLGRTVYLDLAQWSAFPALALPELQPGQSEEFGVVTNPQPYANEQAQQHDDVEPHTVHTGIFKAKVGTVKGPAGHAVTGGGDASCSVTTVTKLTFMVTAKSEPGLCQLVITQYLEQTAGGPYMPGRSVPLVVNIATPGPTSSPSDATR